MSDTPINVFGRSDDAEGIARLVASHLDGSTIQTKGSGFVVSVIPKRRLRRPAAREVTVSVRLDYFEGDPRQLVGMTSFLATTMGGPGLATVLSSLPELRVAMAFVADPEVVPDPSDDLFRLALAAARAADGFVLSIGQGRIWSGEGELLASFDGAPLSAGTDPVDDDDTDDDFHADEDFVPEPPSVERVIRRLLVLTAVEARGVAEADGEYLDEARTGILRWVEALRIDDELEPDERRLLTASAGEVSPEDQVNASWRTEGAAVLAWALGLLGLSPHDEPIDPDDLYLAIGFPDATVTTRRLSSVSLRPREELDAIAARLLAVHWRLREHSLRPRAMNFAQFVQTAWFGPLDLEGVQLVDNDLAVGGRPLISADRNAVARSSSVVMERHLAANWLRDGGLYSETDTPT